MGEYFLHFRIVSAMIFSTMLSCVMKGLGEVDISEDNLVLR